MVNENITAGAVLRELTPPNAWELLNNNRAVLIDVRSTMEYLFVGHPKGAVHIPWIDEPDWNINPEFIDNIVEVTKKNCSEPKCEFSQSIMLICRSGGRSIQSGKTLIQNGFNNVSYVSDGFEGALDSNYTRGKIGGWRFHNLPWEQC